jgi:hypothetical protein
MLVAAGLLDRPMVICCLGLPGKPSPVPRTAGKGSSFAAGPGKNAFHRRWPAFGRLRTAKRRWGSRPRLACMIACRRRARSPGVIDAGRAVPSPFVPGCVTFQYLTASVIPSHLASFRPVSSCLGPKLGPGQRPRSNQLRAPLAPPQGRGRGNVLISWAAASPFSGSISTSSGCHYDRSR